MLWKNEPANRDYGWPAVEQFFGSLPSPLFETGVLLKNDLAIRFSDSGEFRDVLSRPHDFPLLHLAGWLLDDWQVPESAERARFEAQLLPALLLHFAAGELRQNRLVTGATTPERIWLASLLEGHAGTLQAALFPQKSPFWIHLAAARRDEAAAHLRYPLSADAAANWPDDAKLLPLIGDRWAAGRVPVVAAALQAGRGADIPQLAQMVQHLGVAYQVVQDLFAIRRDVPQGRLTYPIFKTLQAAQINPVRPVSVERLLGALLLTGAAQQVIAACAAQLDAGRAIAGQLNLVKMTQYFDETAALLRDVRGLFSLPSTGPAKKTTFRPQSAARIPQLEPVLQAAESFLLADLSFRESWEVQRGLIPGRPELTARAFPVGLILESLVRAGHSLPDSVANVFEILRAGRFRYYEDFLALPPDADDLGLLLRLFGDLPPSQRQSARKMLQTPLRWMESSVLPNGQVPVWFTPDDAPGTLELPLLVWGSHCAATEINLLLGLLAFDWSGYRPLIERSAGSVLGRLARDGLGAALYYGPGYVVWAGFELLTQLAARPLTPELAQKIEPARRQLERWFDEFAGRPSLSAQETALALLASRYVPHNLAAGQLEAWVARLLHSQRHDGSWAAESLFLIPHPTQGSGWYASRLVTTALCYRALKWIQLKN